MPEEASLIRFGTVTRLGVAVAVLMLLAAIALIGPAIQHARESARRTDSRNGLKQIGLALHNYHDTFNVFPPGGVFGSDGTAYHEWTTFIEPYLESPLFYSLVDFDLPWDDPQQLDLFLSISRSRSWTNPSIPQHREGFLPNHYAANQGFYTVTVRSALSSSIPRRRRFSLPMPTETTSRSDLRMAGAMYGSI